MAEVNVPAPGGVFAGATTDRGRTPGGRFNGDGISGFVSQVLEASILWIGVNPPSSDQYILWINTEDARWYGKWADGDSTQWVDLSLPFGEGLPGPRGPQGERGLTGVAGTGIPSGGTTDQILVKVDGTDYNTYWGNRPDDGLNVLNGTGAPDDVSDGIDGEFYIDTSAWYIYGPKASGSWPAGVSIIGPTGATGAAGSDGADGADGVDGADGANGVGVASGGTAGQVLAKIDGTDYNTEWVDQTSGSTGMDQTEELSTSVSLTNTHLAGDKLVKLNNASPITLTVTAGLTGTEGVNFIQTGAGVVTVVEDTGVDVVSRGSVFSSAGEGAVFSLIPDHGVSDKYYLTGDLV